ncbi:TPA: hypothetical protein ACOEOW_003870 [Enterobacter hormaechei subsp. xiangfangensis]
MVKTIDQIANEFFGGNLKRMAIANDMQPSLLSRNKAAGWLVVNGVLMSPRRQLVDNEGRPICEESK